MKTDDRWWHQPPPETEDRPTLPPEKPDNTKRDGLTIMLSLIFLALIVVIILLLALVHSQYPGWQ